MALKRQSIERLAKIPATKGPALLMPAFTLVRCFLALIVLTATVLLSSSAYAQVVITEFMALNDSTILDEDGDLSDWVELFNAGPTTVNLDGWYLTDNDETLTKWSFPAVSLNAGTYLLVWASDKDRAISGSPLHTSFKLSGSGEYLGLVRPDGLTVEHAYAPEYPPQSADVSYGLAANLVNARCFLVPTPGAANDESQACGRVEDIDFDVERGFYDTPVAVNLDTATPGADIYYTLDGREPTTLAGTLYSGAIPVSTTSVLRAAAYAADLIPTASVTHTYIYPNDVINQDATGLPTTWAADYEMDPDVVDDPVYSDRIIDSLLALPTLSMVMNMDDLFGDTQGIYNHPSKKGIEWERAVSVELIHPDGTPGFQSNAGTRIQGDISRSLNRKKSFRLAFKSIYGPSKLEYPLFPGSPVDSFDKIRLRAGSQKSWSFGSTVATYVRDQWVRDTQLATGQLSSRGRFFHLYLNGLYWGVYNAVEKPDEDFVSAHLGGEGEEWDVLKHGIDVVAGDRVTWDLVHALADAGLASPVTYTAIQQYVDVPNLIDYFLTNLFAGTSDWDGNNWYAARRRATGEGFKFFSWDAEQSMVEATTNRTSIDNQNRPSNIYTALKDNPEFLVLFGDHAHRHLFNGGSLTPDSARERFEALADTVDASMVAESARWGDVMSPEPRTRDEDWLTEVLRLELSYFSVRTGIVINQLRNAALYPSVDAPVFNQHGGPVTPGFAVEMTATDGVIYYTIDGSDPRFPGGAISGAATAYGGPATLVAGTVVSARALVDGQWSALNRAEFTIDISVRISELDYHPLEPVAGPFEDDDFEYVEIVNVGANPVDLAGLSLSEGIDFVFPAFALSSGDHAVVVKNQAAFESRHGLETTIVGQYSGRLSNSGERLVLADVAAGVIHDFSYDDGWYRVTDGGGQTLVVRNQQQALPLWNTSQGWRASTFLGGSVGAEELPICSDGADNDGDGDTDLADGGCGGVATRDREDPECNDGLDNDGDGATDLVDLQCTGESDLSEDPDPIDPITCYKIKPHDRPDSLVVSLLDDFDPLRSFTVSKARALCMPTKFGGAETLEPSIALLSYDIREAPGQDKHVKQTSVFVEGLGPIFLDTKKVEGLLIPTAFDPDIDPVAPEELSHGVDRFKCYRVNLTKGRPKYFPRGIEGLMTDAFENRTNRIVKPSRLCNPVEMDGSTIKNVGGKLLCFKAKRAKNQPKHTKRSGIRTSNEFALGAQVDTKAESEFCVPAK